MVAVEQFRVDLGGAGRCGPRTKTLNTSATRPSPMANAIIGITQASS